MRRATALPVLIAALALCGAARAESPAPRLVLTAPRAPAADADQLNAAVLAPDRQSHVLPQPGVARTAIDRRFERASGSLGFLCGRPDSPDAIRARIEALVAQREATQPIRSKTGGSTFKNPPGHKAWQLIDQAGCRGLKIGGAQVSEKHTNFLINTGDATAADLEALGEEVRRRVKEKSGISLEWEIKRVGIA